MLRCAVLNRTSAVNEFHIYHIYDAMWMNYMLYFNNVYVGFFGGFFFYCYNSRKYKNFKIVRLALVVFNNIFMKLWIITPSAFSGLISPALVAKRETADFSTYLLPLPEQSAARGLWPFYRIDVPSSWLPGGPSSFTSACAMRGTLEGCATSQSLGHECDLLLSCFAFDACRQQLLLFVDT